MIVIVSIFTCYILYTTFVGYISEKNEENLLLKIQRMPYGWTQENKISLKVNKQ